MFRESACLKRVLLAAWAVWLSVVFATNVCDAAKAFGMLGDSWLFASGNYRFLTETTARYGTPGWLNMLLFLGVIAWEGTAAVLFWLACRIWRGKGQPGSAVRHAAYVIGLTLWLAFMVADEVFIAYPVEGVHVRLLTALLATVLVIELLPEDAAKTRTE